MPSCDVCLCVSVCLSVCLSLSWVASKRIKISSRFFHHWVAKPFYFSMPNGMAIFRREPPPLTGASNAGGVGKNAILDEYLASMDTGLQCYQPYESRSMKHKAATNGGKRRAEHSRRRPLFTQDDDEVFVMGSTLYAGDGGHTADTTPLVITPFSAAVGHRRTEPGEYFCWKLTLTRTPDPIRPTRLGPDPNRPTNGRKQEALWPRDVCSGGFWSDTAGNNRRQQNRI